MLRREVLKTGLALSAATIASCTTRPHPSGPGFIGDALVQPFDAPLASLNVSKGRVTRTIVGLRPFRKSGPRLEHQEIRGKDIVHNYGHGGGGVSLSWGVAEFAATMAKSYGRQKIAVLGSGSIGLSTALDLQRSGADVTIYAAEFPPYTTSNVAGALWHPVTLFEKDIVSSKTMDVLHRASQIGLSRFIRYANDPRYGVTWIRQFSLGDTERDTQTPYIGGDALYPGLVRNQSGPGPFGFKFYDAYYSLMIDTDIYLRALVNDFLSNGGRMVERTFSDEKDLDSLPELTVVNCIGLGAGKVFNDPDIFPIRGQLSFLLPQNDIDYGYLVGRSDFGLLYSFPRKTGILLGGSIGYDDWDTEPRQEEIDRMVEGHSWLAGKLA